MIYRSNIHQNRLVGYVIIVEDFIKYLMKLGINTSKDVNSFSAYEFSKTHNPLESKDAD